MSKPTYENLINTLSYVKDALHSSTEPWLVEAYNVIRQVLEKAEERNNRKVTKRR